MKWIVRIYALILLAYTGFRTWHFMSEQLPVASGQLLAILFLFATEIGLIVWSEVSTGHTSTYTQHYVSSGLTWLDFAGSFGAGVADMILLQTLTVYQVPPLMATLLIYGMPMVVAINVAGAVIYMANDADVQRLRQSRLLQFEADKQAYDELNANRRKIVASRKQEIYNDMTGDYEASAKNTGKPESIVTGNGRKVYAAESPVNPTKASAKRK